jgi:outer membrane cobalamin receptor
LVVSGKDAADVSVFMPYILFYKWERVVPAILLFVFCSGYVFSQEEADTVVRKLPVVEVVGAARPSVMREGAPLQRLNAPQLEKLGIRDIAEAVGRFAGATVSDYGGVGGLKTISVRSLGAKHTAVSYDGFPVTDAQSGQVDVGRFSLDEVETVALSIGPSDNIFLPARVYASAGALSIVSAEPDFSRRSSLLRARLRCGSFGLFNPSVRYEQKLSSSLSSSASAEWLSSKGNYPFILTNGNNVSKERRTNDDIQSLRLEGNVYGNFDGDRRLRVKIYSYNSERGLPGSVILYNENYKDRLWDDNFFAQASWRQPLGQRLTFEARGKYNYMYSRYRTINDNYADGQQTDKNTQQEIYASAGVLYAPTTELSASLTTDASAASLRNNYPSQLQPERYTSLTAMAAQFKNPRLTVTASLLFTYITDRVNGGTAPADHRRFSPALSVSVRPFGASTLRLRASFKDVFRVPTFADLYYLRFGNLNLVPERATQYNVGTTWSATVSRSSIGLSVDAYYNSVADKIVAIPTLYVWKMMNMGKVGIRGIDLSMNADIALPADDRFGLNAAATYSYQHAVDVTDPESKTYRHQIPYTPRHSATASATVRLPWFDLGYRLTAVGQRFALPQNTDRNRLHPYSEHSLTVGRSFTLRGVSMRLQADAVNIGNTSYEVIQYYPMPERSFRIQLDVRL